jgi:hypothetical protein
MLLIKDPSLGISCVDKTKLDMLIKVIAGPTNMLMLGLKMFSLNDESSKVMKLKCPLQICLKMKILLWGLFDICHFIFFKLQ